MAKTITVNRKTVDDCSNVKELQKCLNWLQPNAKALMFEVYESLNDALKPYCFNRNKTWSTGEFEIVKRYLTDLFNPLIMADVACKTGRSPFAIYMTWIVLMWEATKTDKKRILLKRAIKSAVRYGHAQWEKS